MPRIVVPTPEERALVVAIYRDTGNIDRVHHDPRVAFGRETVRRILDEEGVPHGRLKRRPPEDEFRRIVAPIWQSGGTFDDIRAAVGVKVAAAEIRRIMAGIPRRPPSWGGRSSPPALPGDGGTWQWIAGVFDARGAVVRTGRGILAILVSCGRDATLLDAVGTAIGVGGPRKAGSRAFPSSGHTVSRQADVMGVLAKMRPYLRAKGGVADRAMAELEEKGYRRADDQGASDADA